MMLLLALTGCAEIENPAFVQSIELSPAMLTILQAVVALLMVAGLFSLLLLVIPGLTIIWLSALVYGLLTGFDLTSGIIFAIITLLMVFGNILDQLFMGARAKKSGASWAGVALSTFAAFVFSLLLPPFGGIIAAMLVLFTFEVVRLKDWRRAGGTTKEMALGCASAFAARFAIGLVMIALWVVWVWKSGQLPF